MLKFLFDSKTGAERDDTKALYARLQTLEKEAHVGDSERCEDIASILEALHDEYQFETSNKVVRELLGLVEILVDESDLYSVLQVATEAFIDDMAHDVENRARMVRKISLYQYAEKNRELVKKNVIDFCGLILDALPSLIWSQSADEQQSFSIPILDVLNEAPEFIQDSQSIFESNELENTALFHTLRQRILSNSQSVHESIKKNANPRDLAKEHTASELVTLFLGNTCLVDFLQMEIPFTIPLSVRFEHMHIVAGSGHGKTQTLQYLIARDLPCVEEGKMGFAVIDSQGDLINRVLERKIIGTMKDRVLIVDPNDIAYPPALNMFDIGLSRTENVEPVMREKIINGSIDLYSYIFSSLLGAELTQKQGVIFTYLARMMMVIPGANIHTLRELVENANPFRKYFDKLDPSSRHFFETQFFTPTFAATRQQVLTRLWGVLSNATFERMFSARANKVDIFAAMNEGKIILINTAKDLLKSEGCSIFGRFFIALIAQAALSRSTLSPEDRKPFMVVIDEAHDYFDDRIEDIANQARKYNVGLVLSHQNLDQASTRLRASIMSSTSIKFAGGVSAKDAQVLAQNMQTKPEVILGAKKRRKETQFACFVRNVTPVPVLVQVPFGALEAMPKMNCSEQASMKEANRIKVATVEEELVKPSNAAVSKKEKAATPASTPKKGKGGAQHTLIQKRIHDAASKRGFSTRIEEHVGDGQHADLMIHTGTSKIACEISVSTSIAHEIKNVEKCVAAGFNEIWVISESTAWIDNFRVAVRQFAHGAVTVRLWTPDEAVARLEVLCTEENELPVNGRQTETAFKQISKDAKERREIVLAKIFTDHLQKR